MKKKEELQEWTISRSRSRTGDGWHIQARTADQLSSFAVVVWHGASLLRTKAASGKGDIFTLGQLDPHMTMNVVGKITYTGDWEGVQTH
jgi:hypothetical protein